MAEGQAIVLEKGAGMGDNLARNEVHFEGKGSSWRTTCESTRSTPASGAARASLRGIESAVHQPIACKLGAIDPEVLCLKRKLVNLLCGCSAETGVIDVGCLRSVHAKPREVGHVGEWPTPYRKLDRARTRSAWGTESNPRNDRRSGALFAAWPDVARAQPVRVALFFRLSGVRSKQLKQSVL